MQHNYVLPPFGGNSNLPGGFPLALVPLVEAFLAENSTGGVPGRLLPASEEADLTDISG